MRPAPNRVRPDGISSAAPERLYATRVRETATAHRSGRARRSGWCAGGSGGCGRARRRKIFENVGLRLRVHDFSEARRRSAVGVFADGKSECEEGRTYLEICQDDRIYNHLDGDRILVVIPERPAEEENLMCTHEEVRKVTDFIHVDLRVGAKRGWDAVDDGHVDTTVGHVVRGDGDELKESRTGRVCGSGRIIGRGRRCGDLGLRLPQERVELGVGNVRGHVRGHHTPFKEVLNLAEDGQKIRIIDTQEERGFEGTRTGEVTRRRRAGVANALMKGEERGHDGERSCGGVVVLVLDRARLNITAGSSRGFENLRLDDAGCAELVEIHKVSEVVRRNFRARPAEGGVSGRGGHCVREVPERGTETTSKTIRCKEHNSLPSVGQHPFRKSILKTALLQDTRVFSLYLSSASLAFDMARLRSVLTKLVIKLARDARRRREDCLCHVFARHVRSYLHRDFRHHFRMLTGTDQRVHYMSRKYRQGVEAIMFRDFTSGLRVLRFHASNVAHTRPNFMGATQRDRQLPRMCPDHVAHTQPHMQKLITRALGWVRRYNDWVYEDASFYRDTCVWDPRISHYLFDRATVDDVVLLPTPRRHPVIAAATRAARLIVDESEEEEEEDEEDEIDSSLDEDFIASSEEDGAAEIITGAAPVTAAAVTTSAHDAPPVPEPPAAACASDSPPAASHPQTSPRDTP